jgi:hypothetical protein
MDFTTSRTVASLFLNINLSLRVLQITQIATCHNTNKPFFLLFEPSMAAIEVKAIDRFGGKINDNPSQLNNAYQTQEAKTLFCPV